MESGHHFGNFKNYYHFHSKTERTSRFPAGLFRAIWKCNGMPSKFLILDIGCNEGDLSIGLLSMVQKELDEIPCFILGIDLDTELISRATQKSTGVSYCQFTAYDIMSKYSSNATSSTASSADDADVINEFLKQHEATSFSLVTCFSITMWIHMNFGDDGLNYFFDTAIGCTGNTLLVEPQPWKCYRQAIQRCRRLGIPELPYFQDLAIRDMNTYAKDYLSTHGFANGNVLEGKEWGRELLFFHRNVSLEVDEIFRNKKPEVVSESSQQET